MFSKLAIRNVKRQFGNYMIYFMTIIFTVALLFAVNNAIYGEYFSQESFNKMFRQGLLGIIILISLVVSFILSYATTFMLKLRKREFGTYLTLGMTRKNILTIFLVETLVICTFALAFGLIIGLFLYQGLTAIIANLLELPFHISSYSPAGLRATIMLVGGIFIAASLSSAFYLKKVSIYDLLQGGKKAEKGTAHPLLWAISAFLAFTLLIWSSRECFLEMDKIILSNSDTLRIARMLSLVGGSIILLYFCLGKSLTSLLLRCKRLCNRDTNTFILRQLSGTLSENALMLGCLAFLLTFTVFLANASFILKAANEEALHKIYPYNIIYSEDSDFDPSTDSRLPLAQAEQIIEEYVKIEKKLTYAIYTSNAHDFYSHTQWYDNPDSEKTYYGPLDYFMSLSDFNSITVPLGYEPVTLKDQFMIVGRLNDTETVDWEQMRFQHGQKNYTFHSCRMDYPYFTFTYFLVILPDEALSDMQQVIRYTAYVTEDHPYDAAGLKQRLSYTASETLSDEVIFYEACPFSLLEYGRIEQNSTSAFLVVGALYASAVFLLMAMAILALKTLSTLADNQKRYRILFRLGAGERLQRKTLFRQTFSFFILPFLMPMAMTVPIIFFCSRFLTLAHIEFLLPAISVTTLAIAGAMTVLYLLYYTATYLITVNAVTHLPGDSIE